MKTKRELVEESILRLKTQIHEFDSLLNNQEHPVLQPFLNKLNKRLKEVEYEIDDHEKYTDLQMRMKLVERLVLKRILAFDSIEKALPLFREKLAEKNKELEKIIVSKEP